MFGILLINIWKIILRAAWGTMSAVWKRVLALAFLKPEKTSGMTDKIQTINRQGWSRRIKKMLSCGTQHDCGSKSITGAAT